MVAVFAPKAKKRPPQQADFGLFPKGQTEKEKALLKNKTILSGLAPNFKRGKAVFERNTLKEAGAVQTFRFQCTEEIFHRRVIVQQHGL